MGNKEIYIEIHKNFFRDDKIILLETLKDGCIYSNILMKLYFLTIANGGLLATKSGYKYTNKDVATLTNHTTLATVKTLDALKERGFIKVCDNGTLQMTTNDKISFKEYDEGGIEWR